jgi:hypothetical protein
MHFLVRIYSWYSQSNFNEDEWNKVCRFECQFQRKYSEVFDFEETLKKKVNFFGKLQELEGMEILSLAMTLYIIPTLNILGYCFFHTEYYRYPEMNFCI